MEGSGVLEPYASQALLCLLPQLPQPGGVGARAGACCCRGVGSSAEESGVTAQLQSADFRGQGFLRPQGPAHIDEVTSTEI